jgi:regulator of protease activity HflC (stomatin/prohibitin superfamily)
MQLKSYNNPHPTFHQSFVIVREKEVIVLQQWGKKHSVLTAGIHFIIPIMQTPRKYSWRYFKASSDGKLQLVRFSGAVKISTKTESMDFPKQDVISRDNARITLDAILNYRVSDPAKMIYTTQNLPYMLSKLLQAQIRNAAGTLDVDKIVDDTTVLSGIQASLNNVTQKWGVSIEKVGVQEVQTHDLKAALAKRKTAELNNKEVIINSKTTKQTTIVHAEGKRDEMIRIAEGAAQQTVSRARGEAQAIINRANAEARSVKEIARAVASFGENPTSYLLAVKYIDVFGQLLKYSNTSVEFLPTDAAFLLTTKGLGLSTVMSGGAKGK